MLVDVLIASVLGGVVMCMLLSNCCVVDGALVVLGSDARCGFKPTPTTTAATAVTVAKESLEADDHSTPTE